MSIQSNLYHFYNLESMNMNCQMSYHCIGILLGYDFHFSFVCYYFDFSLLMSHHPLFCLFLKSLDLFAKLFLHWVLRFPLIWNFFLLSAHVSIIKIVLEHLQELYLSRLFFVFAWNLNFYSIFELILFLFLKMLFFLLQYSLCVSTNNPVQHLYVFQASFYLLTYWMIFLWILMLFILKNFWSSSYLLNQYCSLLRTI